MVKKEREREKEKKESETGRGREKEIENELDLNLLSCLLKQSLMSFIQLFTTFFANFKPSKIHIIIISNLASSNYTYLKFAYLKAILMIKSNIVNYL